MKNNIVVTVIGGGLAGCEAALILSKLGVKVRLVEAKPLWFSGAHKNSGLAEIVCSNSFKSTAETTASGALKNELDILGCELLRVARACAVPAGSALAVDRDEFSRLVTERIDRSENIELAHEIAETVDPDVYTIVCAGPLAHDRLTESLSALAGEGHLHFFDAAAPIVTAESVDSNKAFFGARYGKGGDDYLNCPMSKDEYLAFYDALVHAERADAHEVDKHEIFEGCMPVEIMASRGVDALRFGPLRPVGFNEHGKPYAVLQLRKENTAASLYNLVGFQTNLKFPEQRRVFSLIPALAHAEFVRYGVMHRNTFINAPDVINGDLTLKKSPKTFVAGQLCGVEGYVESIATGHLAALNAYRLICGKPTVCPPTDTVLGALCDYISAPNANFQPMNANFGILPPIGGKKADRKRAYYDRSSKSMADFVASL